MTIGGLRLESYRSRLKLCTRADSRSLLFELRSAFTQECAVTFPKKTFFPLAGNGWLLSRSVARASKHLPRSCSATFVSSGLKLIERGGDDFRVNAQTNSRRLRQNLNLL